ncbi:mammalian cell entry protein [Nocardia asteroides]|uniref:mammalian cell entry protein n=1 Tax=Nocardia asteroides TaxID=1824 RepID=UPI001E530584|nr:mammalian cell entry protein [Nocardia asteroides]UGT54936.1 mammalian cell entry protein [Nocardia asteroides]
MPAYTLPGTEVGPRRARLLGAIAVVVAVLGLAVWRAVPEDRPADEIRVALLVGRVGAGVAPGTDVRLDGVRVGAVETIDSAGPGAQRIGVTLSGSQLFGLSDTLTVDYAPGSLFGISAVELHPGAGGVPLAEGATVDLTGRDGARVRDATLSALLTATGALTDQVLTPKLTDLLGTISRDLAAFTPLLEAIGATVRSFTETQRLPPSLLFDQFGSALTGLPPMLTGSLTLLYAEYTNDYLGTPENLEKFGRMFSDIQYRLLPTVTELLTTARQHFGRLLPMTTLVLDQVAGSVSAPERTGGQLGELLDRLDSAFVDTPQGPVLRAAVDLDGVPGLAAPLAALLGQGGR